MHWYIDGLKQYTVFSGRSRRSAYWFFFLFSLLISLGLSAVDSILGTVHEPSGGGLLEGLYSLAVLVPSIAVTVRRLHDTGRVGWWALIGLIPIIGWLVLLYFVIQDSEPGENDFGPNPKGESLNV